jgi:Fe-S-cluster-containing hydrogenase component 2
MLHKTGVPTPEQVSSVFFDESTLSEYKAIIECYEDIPCNPCATSCPVQAITIAPNIHAQPKLDPKVCTGCSICVTTCPGLAIMLAKVVKDKAYFKIPYEMNEVFEKGMKVHAINRAGEVIGEGIILSISKHPHQLKTQLIGVEVDKALLHDFITIRGFNHG